MKPPLVLIEWDDAASCARWMRPEEVHEFHKDKWVAHSVGWEIHSDKQAVTLAASVNPEGWYGETTRIPRGMVLKRTRLR